MCGGMIRNSSTSIVTMAITELSPPLIHKNK